MKSLDAQITRFSDCPFSMRTSTDGINALVKSSGEAVSFLLSLYSFILIHNVIITKYKSCSRLLEHFCKGWFNATNLSSFIFAYIASVDDFCYPLLFLASWSSSLLKFIQFSLNSSFSSNFFSQSWPLCFALGETQKRLCSFIYLIYFYYDSCLPRSEYYAVVQR